jgi:hypothetical protein
MMMIDAGHSGTEVSLGPGSGLPDVLPAPPRDSAPRTRKQGTAGQRIEEP